MVRSLSAAPRDKMKLVHMLRLMHHDSAMAHQARSLCEELLEDYPGNCFWGGVLSLYGSLVF